MVALLLRFIQLLLRHRLAAAVLLVASFAASLYAARSIEVRFQYKDFYEYEGNPRLPLLNRYTEEFGDPAGYVVLLIESRDVFSREVLEYVDSVTRQLEALPEFSKVRSLSNARSIRADGDAVESGPIMRRLPKTPEEVARIRATALDSALLLRRVISPDSSATAVLAEMRIPASKATVPEQQAAIDAVERVVRSTALPPGVHVQVTGAPLVEVETTRALVDDQKVLTPLVFAILILALTLTFRSIHGVVLPLASVSVSLVWTAGVFSFLGHPIDIIGSTIPTVLLVYGVVDPTFVYMRYMEKLEISHTREQAVTDAMRELVLPCFTTSLTTALGFAAFITATLPMVRHFGIAVAIGVLFAFVTTITVLPLLLVAVAPSKVQLAPPRLSVATEALMRRLWHAASARPELMVAIALSLLITGAGAATSMHVVNDYVGSLPQGRVQDSVRVLEEKLSGVVRVAVYLEGEVDSMKSPEVLRAVEALDALAEQQPLVTSSLSLADLVSDTNRAFLGGDANEHRVPESADLISQYLSFINPGDLSDFVSSDWSRSHLRILVSDRGSRSLWQLLEVLQREIDERFPRLGVRATITGHGVASYFDSDRVVEEVLWGFLIAFGAIVFIQFAIFRSLRIALISIVPNLVPVCVCGLVMRALGLNFRIDNSLVMCVSVGGLFNTTIHIVARILQQLRSGASNPDSIVGHSLEVVGPPSLYTAVILSLGFSAMGLSNFPGLQILGLLCLVTLLSGFLADAMLTTAFFRLFFDWHTPRAPELARWPRPRVDAMLAGDEEASR